MLGRPAAAGNPPYQRATGDLDDKVLARVTVHALAKARFPDLGDEARDIILRDQVVEVVVSLQDHAAAAPAVAAAGPALGNVSLTMESNTALAAVSRPRVNFDFVDEHLFYVESLNG